jgi:hypothetical protein
MYNRYTIIAKKYFTDPNHRLALAPDYLPAELDETNAIR